MIKNYFLRIAIVLIIFQLICFFTNKSILGVIYFDGPYYGRVVEAETGKPIAGAAIAGVWKFEHIILFITSRYKFAEISEVTTDRFGKFSLGRVLAVTPWLLTAKLKMSELYVFKSGYDSHPPNMDSHWTIEDEQMREISRNDYQLKFWKECRTNEECIIELNPTKTKRERVDAFYGVIIGKLPLKFRKKIHIFIDKVNVEAKIIGADEWKPE